MKYDFLCVNIYFNTLEKRHLDIYHTTQNMTFWSEQKGAKKLFSHSQKNKY